MKWPLEVGISRGRCVGFSLAALFSLPACSDGEAPARPAAIEGGGTVAPRPGDDGMGGEGGTASGEGTVEGVVVQYRDDSFRTTAPFVSAADVTFLSPMGTTRTLARYDGRSLVGEGAVLGDRWIHVATDDGSGYPTLTAEEVPTRDFEAKVVPAPVLDEIFVNLTTAAELDVSRAQLLILIVDADGNPVSGVDVDPIAARPQFVAYKQGSSWVDYLDETTGEGLAFVPNLEALAFPGQSVQVVLTGAIDGELDVRLARGAITMMTHVVP